MVKVSMSKVNSNYLKAASLQLLIYSLTAICRVKKHTGCHFLMHC